MKVSRNLRLSCRILAAHRLRTTLCIGSVAIGVAAVIVMVSLGRGTERRVIDMIAGMGTNLIVVNAGHVRLVGGRARQAAIVTTLLPADARAIAESCPSISLTSPSTVHKSTVRWESGQLITDILGATAETFRIRNIEIATGRSFESDENDALRRVAVVGPAVVEKLFEGLDPIGLQIRIGRVPFEVIGVTKEMGVDATGVERDNRIIIPLRTAMRRLVRRTYVDKIHVESVDFERLSQAEEEISELLRERHRLGEKPDDFTIQNQATLIDAKRRAARSMTLLVGTLAGVSLVVGGIGILAVMLMSCQERSSEIGVRRAVGASRRDIRAQFLMESMVRAGTGGIVGMAVGVGGAFLASTLGGWDTVVSSTAVLVGLVLSVLVGFVFGIYPASKAAELEPIEALRSE